MYHSLFAVDEGMQQPVWIYSVGTAICSTRINLPDTATLDENHKIESDCFHTDVKHARALGYHSHADFIFYSDTTDQTITRLRVFEGRKSVEKEPITANVPAVKGKDGSWSPLIFAHLSGQICADIRTCPSCFVGEEPIHMECQK